MNSILKISLLSLAICSFQSINCSDAMTKDQLRTTPTKTKNTSKKETPTSKEELRKKIQEKKESVKETNAEIEKLKKELESSSNNGDRIRSYLIKSITVGGLCFIMYLGSNQSELNPFILIPMTAIPAIWLTPKKYFESFADRYWPSQSPQEEIDTKETTEASEESTPA